MVGEENRRWCAPCRDGCAHIDVIAMASVRCAIGNPDASNNRSCIVLTVCSHSQQVSLSPSALAVSTWPRGWREAFRALQLTGDKRHGVALHTYRRRQDLQSARPSSKKDSFPYQLAELECDRSASSPRCGTMHAG
jgi:hypothetical protein